MPEDIKHIDLIQDDEDEGGESGGSELKGSLFTLPPEDRRILLAKLKEKNIAAIVKKFGGDHVGPRRPDMPPVEQQQLGQYARQFFEEHPYLKKQPRGINPNVSAVIPGNPDALNEAESKFGKLNPRLQNVLRNVLRLGARPTPQSVPTLVRR